MKIALILNDDFSMWHFRGGLINGLVSRELEVCVIVPPGPYVTKLEAIGTRCVTIPMNRFITPLQDLQLTWRLYKVFKTEKFDIVHNMTIKPNIFGTIAAKAAGVKWIVCLVSGLGFTFTDTPNLSTRITRSIAVFMYKIALSISHKTWFQNKDDFEYFVEKKIIRPEKGVVIRSGGINLTEYSYAAINQTALEDLRRELHLPNHSKCVLMVAARLIWSKGVREFVEVSKMFQSKYPEWVFLMVCPRDPDGPDSVPDEYINTHRAKNLIIIDYFRTDIKNIIALADIMVLVSYYREGVPRTLLEALAMSKPIITSNSVGCKEVVEDGKNGFLVPAKDSVALSDKLTILMNDENIRREFGKYSREIVRKEFDEGIVVNRVITDLYQI